MTAVSTELSDMSVRILRALAYGTSDVADYRGWLRTVLQDLVDSIPLEPLTVGQFTQCPGRFWPIEKYMSVVLYVDETSELHKYLVLTMETDSLETTQDYYPREDLQPIDKPEAWPL